MDTPIFTLSIHVFRFKIGEFVLQFATTVLNVSKDGIPKIRPAVFSPEPTRLLKIPPLILLRFCFDQLLQN